MKSKPNHCISRRTRRRYAKETVVSGGFWRCRRQSLPGPQLFSRPLTARGRDRSQFERRIDRPDRTAGVVQTLLANLDEVEADTDQSVVRVPGLVLTLSVPSICRFRPSGRYIFVPHETMVGAGASRYDTDTTPWKCCSPVTWGASMVTGVRTGAPLIRDLHTGWYPLAGRGMVRRGQGDRNQEPPCARRQDKNA